MVSRETAGPAPVLPEWMTPSAQVLTTFVDLLSEEGVTRGLIGPREVPRLWDRHLLNCAIVADPALGLVPEGARVADVGSGAGLPGLVWALTRPDLSVTLIEPLLRRTTFLEEAVQRLDLSTRVRVWRGRAEDAPPELRSQDVVTARAVAPLEKLVGWLAPLLAPGGHLVALKGSSAPQEIEDARAALAREGLMDVHVQLIGSGIVDPATTVVIATRSRAE
ncbi:MAG: 16S rRNA (guanine(527)-N(7))-methyltransferase RsmG [Actinomycetales bacterium]|nr:16S rRNA (guanine(527)-N(7))-methyltransferase RsmG [Actinomycetales bacterium]